MITQVFWKLTLYSHTHTHTLAINLSVPKYPFSHTNLPPPISPFQDSIQEIKVQWIKQNTPQITLSYSLTPILLLLKILHIIFKITA